MDVKGWHTSGSGHIGSLSFSTSVGFKTSIFTSWVTLTRRFKRVVPVISKLSTAWSFFFASFMTTSSVAYEEELDDGEAERRAVRRASEEMLTVIVFDALDWIRYPLNSESTLTCLVRIQWDIATLLNVNTHDQTWMPPSFVSLLHIRCMCVSVNLIMHFFCSFSMD